MAQQLATLTTQARAQTPSVVDAKHHALAQYYHASLLGQAQLLAYLDIMHFVGFAVLAVAPLALLMKRPPKWAKAAAAH